MLYIHELANWPNLHWDHAQLLPRLAAVRHQQGFLLGRMSQLGFDIKAEANLAALVSDVTASSLIEGEHLDVEQVRSSLARRLGVPIKAAKPSSYAVDGIVEMMLDATQKFDQPLSSERLFAWHNSLFPSARSGLRTIATGMWRTEAAGAMQVVSGAIGRETIHFEAPAAELVPHEMQLFFDWFAASSTIDPVLKAGVAHFWFLTVHPFEDGNGRIARAISDLCLARAEGSSQRFYSMSEAIQKNRKAYYLVLERCQSSGLDITAWLEWFLDCLLEALVDAADLIKNVLLKAELQLKFNQYALNQRQRQILMSLLDGFEGKLTSSKYAKMAKCSQDTALRDLQQLLGYGILRKSNSAGRSTSYKLVMSVTTTQSV